MGYDNYVIANEKKNMYLKLRIVFLLMILLRHSLMLLYHGGIYIDIPVFRPIYKYILEMEYNKMYYLQK